MEMPAVSHDGYQEVMRCIDTCVQIYEQLTLGTEGKPFRSCECFNAIPPLKQTIVPI